MTGFKIKVCGMTSVKQVEALAKMGVDYAGFIFYGKSPRFVGNKIRPEVLKELTGLHKVGVFVNETLQNILSVVEAYGLDAVQLHGYELPGLCKALSLKTTVIKAFSVSGNEDLTVVAAPYNNDVDYFLFDTKAKEYGGTGKKFDWPVLENATITKPYFLSGGIGFDDLADVKKFALANQVFALDVNSRFEIMPGVKDMGLIKRFTNCIRKGR